MKIQITGQKLNPVKIIEKLGLVWDSEYNSLDVITDPEGDIEIDCPDSIVDDVRELIEPYQSKAAFKLSQLSELTQSQLETYIDNNVTTLSNAKDYLKKLSAVVLYLVKHTQMDR